jgi:hypothetical protein
VFARYERLHVRPADRRLTATDLVRGGIDKFRLDTLLVLATGAGPTVEWRIETVA